MWNMMLRVCRRRRAGLWRMIMSMRKSEEMGGFRGASGRGGLRCCHGDLSEMEVI